MDEELRKLERLAALGDPEAQATLERWRQRLKEETPEERASRLAREAKSRLWDRVHHIIEAGRRRAIARHGEDNWRVLAPFEDLNVYDGWAEGSGDPDVIVVTANWNEVSEYRDNQRHVIDDSISRVGDILGKIPGVDTHWNDETSRCDGCNKAVLTSPTSYGWTPAYAVMEGELLCRTCLLNNVEEYLESLEGDPRRSLSPSLQINLADHQYRQVEGDFESGWHPGQTDDPRQIAEQLIILGANRFIFQIEDVGQFDARWSLWVHHEDLYLLGSRAHSEGFNTGYHFANEGLNIINYSLEHHTDWSETLNQLYLQGGIEPETEEDDE